MQENVVQKPLLRGVMHQWAFFLSIPGAGFLIFNSPSPIIFWSMLVYALSLLGLLGISALFHRVNWSPRYRQKMGIADRTMIYLFIAGNFTPFAFIAMDGALPIILLVLLWSAAVLGSIVNVFWYDAPNWIHAFLYTFVACMCFFALPQILSFIGMTGVIWILLGGLVHLIGGMVYALRFPDPSPQKFGFHEVFHCFVTVGLLIHYGVVVNYLLLVH